MVPVVGLEPTSPHRHLILSQARIPFHHTGISHLSVAHHFSSVTGENLTISEDQISAKKSYILAFNLYIKLYRLCVLLLIHYICAPFVNDSSIMAPRIKYLILTYNKYIINLIVYGGPLTSARMTHRILLNQYLFATHLVLVDLRGIEPLTSSLQG